MSVTDLRLEAGGLVPVKSKVDKDATETVVARRYGHSALGKRPVIRLGSDRLGEAEDLAMEFLGFDKPDVSKPLAIQQRRSLGFAAWALINDQKNARYALELVKRMKAAARKAKSKPGHAWDAYTDMSKELGKSARHFLPPYWEEVGRTYKDLGNFTYAGRALSKSLEAERVHALESDKARRRDVVLEFVLAGCLAGKALSEYANDLLAQYPAEEAYAIFRDLCQRRTRGGMAPWSAMPKDFAKMAKAAKLDPDAELESWLEEVIDAPGMGRVSQQFWKTCKKHVARIIPRNPAFAISLLRHTKPVDSYRESNLMAWMEMLEEWGVLEFLWKDGHKGAPPLGEPVAIWFGRIIRDELPVPKMVLEILEKLESRLIKEDEPIPLSEKKRWSAHDIDIDVLETCLAMGLRIADLPEEASVSFTGWLMDPPDHPFRNRDPIHCAKDERFGPLVAKGMPGALACRGGNHSGGWRRPDTMQRPFPQAAGDRPGILKLWKAHFADLVDQLEGCGFASFRIAVNNLEETLWPETIKNFPKLAQRVMAISNEEMLQTTIAAGVFAEYGWPDLEAALAKYKIKMSMDYDSTNVRYTFPDVMLNTATKVIAVGPKGTREWELQIPKKSKILTLTPVGDELCIEYQDKSWDRFLVWSNEPKKKHKGEYRYHQASVDCATDLDDGSVFLGKSATRVGDKKGPESAEYFHDNERFWVCQGTYVGGEDRYQTTVHEIDPQTGKKIRESVPKFFEKTAGGKMEFGMSELLKLPEGVDDSPLGSAKGLIGWKAVKRKDGSFTGEGIDGRKWTTPLRANDDFVCPIALLPQPGTDKHLPVTHIRSREGSYWLWDPTGSTVVAIVEDFGRGDDAEARPNPVLPMVYWHLMKVRDEASSLKLRKVSKKQCADLLNIAISAYEAAKSRRKKKSDENELAKAVQPAVAKLIPKAPPSLQSGVVETVLLAAEQASRFNDLRDHASGKSKNAESSAKKVPSVDTSASMWDLNSFDSYGETDHSVSAHMVAVGDFLKGDDKEMDLPLVDYSWFDMLGPASMRCWSTMWNAYGKEKTEKAWVEFLEFFVDSGMMELPGEFATMNGVPNGAKKDRWGGYDIDIESGTSFGIKQGKDNFIFVEDGGYDAEPYVILRYSTAKTPGTPKGYKVKNVKKLKGDWSREQLKEFAEAFKAAGSVPLPSADEIAESAERIGNSTAEVALIWLAGLNMNSYTSNFMPSEIRKALNLKVTDASAGKQSLSNLKDSVVQALYKSVLAKGPSAPFAENRSPVFAAIEKAWKTKMPKRLALDAGLQKRLSALAKTSRWHRIDHETLLAAAAEPTKSLALTPRAMTINQSKTRYGSTLGIDAGKESLGDDMLRSAVHLISLVNSACPAGAPVRSEMVPLFKQVVKVLNDKRTLLELRHLHVYDYDDKKSMQPTAWLAKFVGKTKTDAKKVARYDDGLIVGAANDASHEVILTFRSSKLKDAADLARLNGVLALDCEEPGWADGTLVPLALLYRSPGMQQLIKSIVSKDLDAEAWPQNPLLTSPDTVADIAKKKKLSEEAAMLYLQILALPEPTTANIRIWNDWKPATIKNASAELVKAKLVLEAKRSRACRTLFLPGEWVDLKSPWLPIEAWKSAHLCEFEFPVATAWPAGGPMVLRPFADLYSAAWQRVLDGDEPKYEEVKRKGRGRKKK